MAPWPRLTPIHVFPWGPHPYIHRGIGAHRRIDAQLRGALELVFKTNGPTAPLTPCFSISMGAPYLYPWGRIGPAMLSLGGPLLQLANRMAPLPQAMHFHGGPIPIPIAAQRPSDVQVCRAYELICKRHGPMAPPYPNPCISMGAPSLHPSGNRGP